MDPSEFKMLKAIGEGKATPEDIDSDVVDKLQDLWTRGRIYYDGSTLIVKYLDMVHETLSRVLAKFFGNATRTDGEEALLPMGSTNVPLSNGGVKQPDESFTIAPTSVPRTRGSMLNPNLVVEAQNTHLKAREAIVMQLSNGPKVHQALVLDLKHSERKQVVRVILERWQRERVLAMRAVHVRLYKYRDSWGKMHTVQAGKVYGINQSGTYYLRSSQAPDYTRCVFFGLPRPDNRELCYRTKSKMIASYELYGENVNPQSEEKLVFTVGQLENTDDATVIVEIPIAVLARKIKLATDAANEREREILDSDTGKGGEASTDELEDRASKSGGKRAASELSDDSEPPEMDNLLDLIGHRSKRRA
ncbi:hypothetical protein CERSUDRAFT_101238 [Gelatoporia subvermispora B]|uniref:Uncharacterized protein n=1 Tax=Ceriporiopsis subvermispora (strain B) TaxID=914234 RepID=M2Q167_CERS8|nr:hypothetical protein CERSUDRAFT_101238 [Gelatoporia subvermispora B]